MSIVSFSYKFPAHIFATKKSRKVSTGLAVSRTGGMQGRRKLATTQRYWLTKKDEWHNVVRLQEERPRDADLEQATSKSLAACSCLFYPICPLWAQIGYK